MSITEPGVQTSQYAADTTRVSDYMLPNLDWQYQYHSESMDYQQPMEDPFPQHAPPQFDFQVSQYETIEHIPITQPVSDRYATGDFQATQRRRSLQPLPPQTPSENSRPRSASLATPAWSSSSDTTQRGMNSRSASPSAAELEQYGYAFDNGSWRCSYPECRSTTVFRRPCDLRKHHKRHFKKYFCRSDSNCQHHSQGGFSSKKDRDRHEASHNPSIPCSHSGCTRMFSRADNMVIMPSFADGHELTSILERSCEKNSRCATSQDKVGTSGTS